MHFTIEHLMHGDDSVPGYFMTARNKWRELFGEDKRDASVEEWANWLSQKQIIFFERECGGKPLGQEIMAWSGFGSLYSTQVGFEDNERLAKKLAEAFDKSTCSTEVKVWAGQAFRTYGI